MADVEAFFVGMDCDYGQMPRWYFDVHRPGILARYDMEFSAATEEEAERKAVKWGMQRVWALMKRGTRL